jgi:hypothetical protein
VPSSWQTVFGPAQTKQQYDELAYRQHTSPKPRRLLELVSTQPTLVDGLHRFPPCKTYSTAVGLIRIEKRHSPSAPHPQPSRLPNWTHWLDEHMTRRVALNTPTSLASTRPAYLQGHGQCLLAIRLAQGPGDMSSGFGPR